MATTETETVSYLDQLKGRCPFDLPGDYNKRSYVDHLHAEVAALANPAEHEGPLVTLHDARWLQDSVDRAMLDLVDNARAAGATWKQIGEALGVTRQAAQMRWGK
jgi:hypothetical protein